MRSLSRSMLLVMISVVPLFIINFTVYHLNGRSANAQSAHKLIEDASAQFPIVSTPTSGDWADISGNCVVYRGSGGNGVYLHNLETGNTITLSDKSEPEGNRKISISKGFVVWRSEIEGERGLWGYYAANCGDSMLNTSSNFGPYFMVSRLHTHALALSGEMLTFDTGGIWYVGMVEMDANNNQIPDAAEEEYDPFTDYADNYNRLSCCSFKWDESEIYYQRISAIYWDETYKIACWHDVETSDPSLRNRLECDELSNWQDSEPWTDNFLITETAAMASDFKGMIAIHKDLVVWTTAKEGLLTGFDLYITELDNDDDGVFDDPESFKTYHLVDWPWDQEYPDIEWPYVVWSETRNGNQEDIYAYDLSLDSNGNGIPNWKDETRSCIDPAEFPVAIGKDIQQSYPELSGNSVIWVSGNSDQREIYGATLSPQIASPRDRVAGTPLQKAETWLDIHLREFETANEIPGYDQNTGMVNRYMSYKTADDEIVTIIATYPAITGSYLISFDACNFGTLDQKRYLGKFGRGFVYDQALHIISRRMLEQNDKATEAIQFMRGYLNVDPDLPSFAINNYGFSLNGEGFLGEKDTYYDMLYIRNGANGWLGYSLAFLPEDPIDPDTLNVMKSVGDYLLTQQIIDTNFITITGLFTGGYGNWPQINPEEFQNKPITWAAAEHNIDIYFFLRDLGKITGEDKYTNAASQLVTGLESLWDEDLGRLHQGVDTISGTIDTSNALDAASWGAIYWTAIGNLDRAHRSLQFAHSQFLTTVTADNTVDASSLITVTGFKPYGHSDEIVWSEGTLGVAMAHLKLGHALIDQCNDPFLGNVHLQKAENIMEQMELLQTLDPQGGLFYALYSGDEIGDFARMPSAAGTTWFVMVKKAIENKQLRDAFWSADENPTKIICAEPEHIYLPIVSSDIP